LPLVLSATRRHVTAAEKHVVALIIGSQPVNSREMSTLVRIRLICAELLTRLAQHLDNLKPPHLRNSRGSFLGLSR
jgi:hypothetical protein